MANGFARLAVLVVATRTAVAWAAEECQFDNVPVYPGYFWDPTCRMGDLGCNADARHVECRFCGGHHYTTPCPASSCHFPGGDPFVPYFWDETCKMGMLGCWADGIHAQCRFCGAYPYTSIECSEAEERTAPPTAAACTFPEGRARDAPTFWDPTCVEGALGCGADGDHLSCRFCGQGAYEEIACPPAPSACTFASEPTVPYYWEPECHVGMLGCHADGIHPECRFCATRPFEDIACPPEVAPAEGKCTFPASMPPSVAYFWDTTCESGDVGCWADGIHRSCRFCGSGVFENVTCPGAREAEASRPATAGAAADPSSMPKRREAQGAGGDAGGAAVGAVGGAGSAPAEAADPGREASPAKEAQAHPPGRQSAHAAHLASKDLEDREVQLSGTRAACLSASLILAAAAAAAA